MIIWRNVTRGANFKDPLSSTGNKLLITYLFFIYLFLKRTNKFSTHLKERPRGLESQCSSSSLLTHLLCQHAKASISIEFSFFCINMAGSRGSHAACSCHRIACTKVIATSIVQFVWLVVTVPARCLVHWVWRIYSQCVQITSPFHAQVSDMCLFYAWFWVHVMQFVGILYYKSWLCPVFCFMLTWVFDVRISFTGLLKTWT